jgi:UDP-GlcNAc:undecaprenyl-phosphate GlcNAc-1-phosphate transferase
MHSYLAVFAASLVVSVLLTPLMRRLGLRLRAVSGSGGRHVHANAIPRLGGISLALGWSIPLLVMFLLDDFAIQSLKDGTDWRVFGVLVGGLFLCGVGAVDDIRGLRAHHKLAAQVLAATVAYVCGYRIDAIALPFGGVLSMGAFALPVTVLWIVGITNALNLIDGLDGLAAGVGFFAALTSFVLAYLSGSVFVALLMAALMGVLIGFLFFNFNPARIFMGDSGSYFLGFVLATTSLAGSLQQKASTAVSLLVPMIALGLPIFDTLFSMVRRLLERRSIFSPDRGHIHHRLLDLGLTHRRAVMVLYAVSIVLAATAMAVSLGRKWEVGLAMLAASVVFVALVRFVGYFEYLHTLRRQKARLYDEGVERLRRALPDLMSRAARSRTETDVFDLINEARRQLRLEVVEVVGTDFARRWEADHFDNIERDFVQASYPLGRDDRARAKIRFAWQSAQQDVAPQIDILLQVLTDALTGALTTTGSSLAPRRADAVESQLQTSAPLTDTP